MRYVNEKVFRENHCSHRIGAALFFVLGYFVKIPSPVPNTSISVQ